MYSSIKESIKLSTNQRWDGRYYWLNIKEAVTTETTFFPAFLPGDRKNTVKEIKREEKPFYNQQIVMVATCSPYSQWLRELFVK